MSTPDTNLLASAFASGVTLPSQLDTNFEEALRHVLDHPGSLIRPKMIYQIGEAYGLTKSASIDLAIALEYFHTASLLFDDLPCMDNARERRGVPCVHIVYGESGAILTALALINQAYALLWRSVRSVPFALQADALTYIEQRLGVGGLLNGQSLDLHYATLPHDRATTEAIARGKTVSLIRLTLVLPAMLGGASVRELRWLERISLFWGLSYQMVDDLKDVLASADEAGKTVARDLFLDRPNAAAVLGVDGAVKRLMRYMSLGDRTLQRLLQSRPALAFLATLRKSLEAELALVAGHASLSTSGVRS